MFSQPDTNSLAGWTSRWMDGWMDVHVRETTRTTTFSLLSSFFSVTIVRSRHPSF